MNPKADVAVIGGGLSGLTAAALLQRAGLQTVVFESHTTAGGCAGYFRRRGFSFDVGATTLVDFEPDGVGGKLLDEIGVEVNLDQLPGYRAWLPGATIALHRDVELWAEERRKLGDTGPHRNFWQAVDDIAGTFWSVSRRGGRMPIRGLRDVWRGARSLRAQDLGRLRYLRWTAMDLLRRYNLEGDEPLRGLLSMIVEDTVHASLERAPLVHAALGITMRGAGLSRARGGMRGFFEAFLRRYEQLGGSFRRAHAVERIEGEKGRFSIRTLRGVFEARHVISTLPIEATSSIAPAAVRSALGPFVARDTPARGGAIVVFMGVPDSTVEDRQFTHHQIMDDLDAPLGDGNNMFVSVSAPGDQESAPVGWRSVMMSTHCELAPWSGKSREELNVRKDAMGRRLIRLARRVYPTLGDSAKVLEVGSPATYARFTRRPYGAVGGVRMDLDRAGQRAVPQDIGVPGFSIAGDTTWPGVGTVACVISGRAAAEHCRRQLGE